MPLFEKNLLFVLAGLAVLYVAYRLIFSVDKTEKLYNESIERIINSEECKVKGRFE